MVEADGSSARADRAMAKMGIRSQRIVNFPAETAARRFLEPQRRLITHGHAVQHITRRRGRSVSRGMRTRLSDSNASGDWRSQAPATIGYGLVWDNGSKPGDIRRWRSFVNLARDH